MSVSIWRIAVDAPNYLADDLSGEGAKRSGGRWNRCGLPVVYCASNVSLCVLETIVHIQTDDLPLNRYLVEVNIPDALWKSRLVLEDPAPQERSSIARRNVSQLNANKKMLVARQANRLRHDVL